MVPPEVLVRREHRAALADPEQRMVEGVRLRDVDVQVAEERLCDVGEVVHDPEEQEGQHAEEEAARALAPHHQHQHDRAHDELLGAVRALEEAHGDEVGAHSGERAPQEAARRAAHALGEARPPGRCDGRRR